MLIRRKQLNKYSGKKYLSLKRLNLFWSWIISRTFLSDILMKGFHAMVALSFRSNDGASSPRGVIHLCLISSPRCSIEFTQKEEGYPVERVLPHRSEFH